MDEKKELNEQNIRDSLIKQLAAQMKNTAYCEDLVDNYMDHWRLRKKLQEDIEESGLWVTVAGGNGFKAQKRNPSIRDAKDETAIMLQILDKLGLKEPVAGGSPDDYL